MKIHHLTVADAFASLKSGLAGLSDAEAARRLDEFGANQVEEVAHQSLLLTFAKELAHFFAIILWIAAGLAFFAEWRDPRQGMAILGFAIVGFVVINGVFSFWQAYRAPSVDALIPALYLKGISTGDFSEALTAILGEGASGLSATNIVRLKAGWEADYKAWSQRDLSQKRYVYWWADGVYFNVRLDEERTCVLVLIGATEDGAKELLAVVDGYRESAQSWRDLVASRRI